MKQFVIRLSGLAALALFSHLYSVAQDDQGDSNQQKVQKDRENKLRDGDEIVIKRSDDKDVKVTIEIKGDQVFVNGKPVSDFDDVDVTVKKMKVPFFDAILAAPKSPFRGGWSYNGDGDLEELNDAKTAFLGVSWEDVDKGAKITEITRESAAEKAGLKKGDIITKIGDTKIEDGELSSVIHKYKPEDKITVTYIRDGKEQTATATLGKSKSMKIRSFNMNMPRINGDLDFGVAPVDKYRYGFGYVWNGKPKLGIKAQDLEEGKGAKVLDVDEDSPADKAGVKEGDVINEFEGKPVENAEDLSRLARENKEKYTYKIKLTRDGKSQEVEVKIPKKLKTADL